MSLSDGPLCLCGTLRMTARAVSAVYDDALRPLGLRVTQFSLLWRAASMGPVESWRLSAALGLDKTTLPRNLRPLERRGLVAIEPGEDRRTRLVRVTPAGEKLLKQALTCWRSVQASFKKRLHDDEFDRTLRQLLRVRAVARALNFFTLDVAYTMSKAVKGRSVPLLEPSAIDPTVAKTFPLEKATDALRRLVEAPPAGSSSRSDGNR